MIPLLWIVLILVGAAALVYHRATVLVSLIGMVVLLLLMSFLGSSHYILIAISWILFAVVFAPLLLTGFRRQFITKKIFATFCKLKPAMSDTEKSALNAGTVGFEGEIFSGKPNWKKLLSYPRNNLRQDEIDFLNGPTEEVCKRVSDNWKIRHEQVGLSDEQWSFIRKSGFIGLIIPKKYGGQEMSAIGHALVISKIASASLTAGICISVPNSLGPAELLLKYGTEEQKDYYLPRLARGDELPCFGLTSPKAGSDAASITDTGIVCEREFEGKMQKGILLNWDKRYITLAPIATLLGLAFKLYDPDHLLSEEEDRGITCALIPTKTPGVVTGRRHYPMHAPFPNGPTQGKDVFIPLDWVVGGEARIGQGWNMLMECLAAGRAISIPSMVCGGVMVHAVATGAYSRIRQQFNTSIGNFGGVEEALARIAAKAFLMLTTRDFTSNVIDSGQEPSVASAITKFQVSNIAREALMDAMDIHGGKAICLGPKNYMAAGYEESPVAITVEGANILTRSMIIFGQGLMRCHPYVLKEMEVLNIEDKKLALKKFDKIFCQHMGFIVSNKVRAFVMGLTGARFVMAPNSEMKRTFQQVTRLSSAFALLCDSAMATYGGQLKRKEKMSARIGDVLSNLYMLSGLLKRFELEDKDAEFHDVYKWLSDHLLFETQVAINDLLQNYPMAWAGKLLRFIIFPWGSCFKKPTDRCGKRVAQMLMRPSKFRDVFKTYGYFPDDETSLVGRMSAMLESVEQIEALEKKMRIAEKSGKIKAKNYAEKVSVSVTADILTQAEADQLMAFDKKRMDVIDVDDFAPEELLLGAKTFNKTSSGAAEL